MTLASVSWNLWWPQKELEDHAEEQRGLFCDFIDVPIFTFYSSLSQYIFWTSREEC